MVCGLKVNEDSDYTIWRGEKDNVGNITKALEVIHESCWVTTPPRELKIAIDKFDVSKINANNQKELDKQNETINGFKCSCGNHKISKFKILQVDNEFIKLECQLCGVIHIKGRV